ncbi:MAG: hypothetical protein AAGH89_10710 [Verrucomicrobiota bacterium]
MVSALVPILLLVGTSTYENGPVRAFVELKAAEKVTVADHLTLRVTMMVPEVPLEETRETGNQRRFKPEPPYRKIAAAPGLTLVDSKRSISGKRSAGFVVDQWEYRLQPELPGEGSIPELTLVFWPNDDLTIPLTITSEPISFVVASIVEGDPLEAELKPAVSSVGPDRGWKRWLLILAIVAVWGALRFRYWKERIFGRETADSTILETRGASSWFRALNDAIGLPEMRHVLEKAFRERFDLDLATMDQAQIERLSILPANLRAELAEITSDLDVAAFARSEGNGIAELRLKIEKFLESIR